VCLGSRIILYFLDRASFSAPWSANYSLCIGACFVLCANGSLCLGARTILCALERELFCVPWIANRSLCLGSRIVLCALDHAFLCALNHTFSLCLDACISFSDVRICSIILLGSWLQAGRGVCGLHGLEPTQATQGLVCSATTGGKAPMPPLPTICCSTCLSVRCALHSKVQTHFVRTLFCPFAALCVAKSQRIAFSALGS